MFHVAARNGLAAYCRELVEIGAIPAVPIGLQENASALAG